MEVASIKIFLTVFSISLLTEYNLHFVKNIDIGKRFRKVLEKVFRFKNLI